MAISIPAASAIPTGDEAEAEREDMGARTARGITNAKLRTVARRKATGRGAGETKTAKKDAGAKKKRRSSRTDSTSSFTSMSKRSTYSEKLAAVETEITHPELLGMDRAAFEQRLKECPDFVRVVHNFIQHEHMTRAANRGEIPCNDEVCTHMLSWAVPWAVPDEDIRVRNCYSQAGQDAAHDMFAAMQRYLMFFKPAPGESLQPQVPAGTGSGGGGLPCPGAFSRFTAIFFI